MIESNTALPTLPGTKGFGSTTVGGRGGRVIKVTNLNPSGPGSLQEAAAAEGPRIVVFEVSGVIHGDIQIRHPYITIAGQTATGAGITIEGMVHSYGLDVHDVIIRFMRIRPRRITGATGDAIQMGGSYNVILDHVSMSWAVDEVVDIITSHDWTIQWCTIEESDTEGHDKGQHNYGLLAAYSGTGNISIHHNLFAHHISRNPSITPYVPGQPGDFRNNVVYDFETGFPNLHKNSSVLKYLPKEDQSTLSNCVMPTYDRLMKNHLGGSLFCTVYLWFIFMCSNTMVETRSL